MDFFTVSTLTGRVLFVLVLISHDRRRIVQPAFNIRRIERHIPLMVEEAQRTLRAWTVGADVNVYEELRRPAIPAAGAGR